MLGATRLTAQASLLQKANHPWPRRTYPEKPLTFGGALTLLPQIVVPDPTRVTPEFIDNVTQAASIAFSRFPQRLKQDLLDHGYQIVLTDKASTVAPYATTVPPVQIQREIDNFRDKVVDQPLRNPDILDRYKTFTGWKNGPVASDDQTIQSFLALEWADEVDEQTAFMDPTNKRVVITEFPVIETPEYWKNFITHVGRLAKTITHETGHFVDFVMGPSYVEGQYAHQRDYMKAVHQDVLNAHSENRLPNAHDHVGPHPTPYHYYMPYGFLTTMGLREPEPSNADTQESTSDFNDARALSESFAEAFASHYGGGAMSPKETLELLPLSRKYLSEHVLSRYETLDIKA